MNKENITLITETQVAKVAQLARLHLDEKNLAVYTRSLSNILHMITQINSQDTKDILPMTSPLLNAVMPLRPDQVTETDHREIYQIIAPLVEAGLYLVPQVIE